MKDSLKCSFLLPPRPSALQSEGVDSESLSLVWILSHAWSARGCGRFDLWFRTSPLPSSQRLTVNVPGQSFGIIGTLSLHLFWSSLGHGGPQTWAWMADVYKQGKMLQFFCLKIWKLLKLFEISFLFFNLMTDQLTSSFVCRKQLFFLK